MACNLRPYAHMPGLCDRCGTSLTGRQKTWCSDDCKREHWRDHYWSHARPAVLERDAYTCRRCGLTPEQVIAGNTWLEVNHIEPRLGQGYHAGCHHHRTNLETLCYSCHVRTTTRQRTERLRTAPTQLTFELAELA